MTDDASQELPDCPGCGLKEGEYLEGHLSLDECLWCNEDAYECQPLTYLPTTDEDERRPIHDTNCKAEWANACGHPLNEAAVEWNENGEGGYDAEWCWKPKSHAGNHA